MGPHMRIEELSLALRARNAWEAFDLGIALARRTGAPLFAGFALPYLSFAVIVNLALWGHPTIAALVVWWAKPLFDRIALSVLAQGVFGAAPGVRATLRGLAAIPRTGLFAALTVQRFDLARSFHLPIAQLEGQAGRSGRARRALLDRRTRGHAVWLMVVVVHFVYVLVLGFDGLLRLLAPEGLQFGFGFSDLFDPRDRNEGSLRAQYLFNIALLAADCILEPLYVSAGFTLYLSRRTALEGWDLEIAFRRLALRRAKAAAGALLAIMLGLALTLGPVEPVHAATAGPAHEDTVGPAQAATAGPAQATTAGPVHAAAAGPAQATATGSAQALPARSGVGAEKTAIEDILRAPEFREFEETRVWRRKGLPPDETPEAEKPPVNFDFLSKLARVLSELVRIAAWIAAVLVAGWLLYWISQRLGWFRRSGGPKTQWRPEVMFGLDLRPESLPADIAAAARERLAAADLRAAMSLLYRGALAGLVSERHLILRASDTEGDCARRVATTVPAPLAGFFDRLVQAWGQIAYARRLPEPAHAARMIDEWELHFGPARPAATGALA